ncbi:MAG: extracellular solute-binding protein [Ruminococcaceae bacterium]|nr:extracellular solute-binding protein [Oscillospiraceae bacterium]
MKKKLISLVLAAIMILTLAACTGTSESGNDVSDNNQTSGEKLFAEGTTFKVLIDSHASWPYDENWPMWKLFEEATGAKFDVLAVPAVDMATKLPLMMTDPDDLPDMMFFISAKHFADIYGPDGAFASVSENLDKMPNYKAFWESLPEGERNDNMILRISGDGNIYAPPNYGVQTVGNTRTWMYRKDIFEKHNLKTPETTDELYETAKKLKELYPDSYPLSLRSGFGNMNLMGPMWKEHFALNPYFDYNDNKWHYGIVEPEAREMVEFFRKLYTEELITPNFFTIPALSWEELVNTDRGFMMLEYLLRLDHFNIPAREKNPEYTWASMMPPKATNGKGKNEIGNQSYELAGYVVCNTGDEEMMENSFKLLDWLYSPEGIEFQSWGKEGVTYEEVDGEKKWIVGEFGSPYADLGIGTPGLYQVVKTEANEALYSEEQGINGEFCRKFQASRINPFNVLSFPDEVATERGDLYTSINQYVEEMVSKFIMGLEPMENWDEFVDEVNSMGVERLLELYTERYNDVLKNIGW